MDSIKRVFKYAFKPKRYIIIAFILVVIETSFELLIPFVMSSLIDDGVKTGNMPHIYFTGIIIFICAIISLLTGYLYSKFAAKAAAVFGENIRNALFEKIESFSFSNLDHFQSSSLVTRVIKNVYDETGITATAGIGTNLYLCKVAMDIVAKHITPDKNGVRIAGLDEMTYRKYLWSHRPLTDFWRVGKGISNKLEKNGIYTMGDIARTSEKNEELLYKLFGINAELLIDHAWGYEPCTIESIKSYKPTTNSISSGQVLHCPYNYEQTKLIVKEMTELLTLDLVKKNLVTSKMVLTIGYDIENLLNPEINKSYLGEVSLDHYGRKVPKSAHGTINIDHKTSSTKIITDYVMNLYESIINKNLLVRRINITAEDVVNEDDYKNNKKFEQIDLFVDYNEIERQQNKEKSEKELQKAVLDIKTKYGKNAVLKGMNLIEGGTTIERNGQIGGHKS